MISATVLQQLVDRIESTPPNRWDEALGSGVTEKRLTVCLQMDVHALAKPVYQGQGFNLYLVNSASGCASLTNDLSQASGVVLAVCDEEEE